MPLDKRSIERLQHAVDFSENTPPALPNGGRGQGRGDGGFWAKITDSNNEGRYSWVALEIKDGSFSENEDWGSGSHDDEGGFAAEKIQSKHVIKGSIVWLEIFPTEHVYIFEYNDSKIAQMTTDISGRSGTTLGQGTVTVETIEDGNTEPTSVSVTVFNHKETPLTLGFETKIIITHIDGHWVVDDQQPKTILARLTGRSAWKYGWQQIKANADGTFSNGSLSGSAGGTNFAVSTDGTEHALVNSVVRLNLTEHGHYEFLYHPGMMTAKSISSTTIPGRQGATPGNATITIEWFNGIALSDQGGGTTVTVYNNFRKSVEGTAGEDLYLQLAYGQSVWWVISADCLTQDEEA